MRVLAQILRLRLPKQNARVLVLLFGLLLLALPRGVVAQPSICDPNDLAAIEPYTAARIHVDDDATASDNIHISINGFALPTIPTGASFTDDEVIIAIQNAIEAQLCQSGACIGNPRFTVTKVGDTTLLVTGDRQTGTDIVTFNMYCEDDGGFFLNWQLVQMPAMVIDFDPKNPMGGFDVDTTEATGDSGQGATIIGNRDTTSFSFNFSAISGLKDQELAVAYMDQILGDPANYCMMGARSGFVLLRQGDLPVVEGTLILADETMGGIAVVPPVIAGVTPDIVDPADGGTGTITIRGYNMLDPDNFNGVIPCVEVGGVDVGAVTAPNQFTLQFTAPALANGAVRNVAVLSDWGNHIAFDRLAYSNRAEVRCRMSNVNATAINTLQPFSLSYDTLLINGSSGNALNEITLSLSDKLTIRMNLPPSIPSAASYILWADIGNSAFEPGPSDVTPRGLNGSQGSTCRPFNLPSTKTFMQTAPRFVINNLRISTRLGIPRNIFLQALIRDDASNDQGGGPKMSVTNGILLRIVQ